MPRRSAQAMALSNAPSQPPLPPSPTITQLRQMWQFAAISQFMYLFEDAFSVPDFNIEELEKDFDGTQTELIPTLMTRLLYALTLNRLVTLETWQHYLRREYLRRTPDAPVLGTEEEPIAFETLSLTDKVKVVHTLCEWHMHNPTRLRQLLKSEELPETWRVDPIGWDAKDNTYWLFDDNRLWVQHPPPAPPKPAKASAPKKSSKSSKSAKSAKSSKSKKKQPAAPATPSTSTPSAAAARKSHKKYIPIEPVPEPAAEPESLVLDGRRRSRAAATRAKEAIRATPTTLVGMKRAAERNANGNGTPSKRPRSSLGTRMSSRLRGEEAEWQEIPPEWLEEGKVEDAESDESSELSEPPELELEEKPEPEAEAEPEPEPEPPLEPKPEPEAEAEIEAEVEAQPAEEEPVKEEEETEEVKEEAPEEEDEPAPKPEPATDDKRVVDEIMNNPEPDWLEWECVCVSLYDWENFPKQFESSKHPDEKALHKLLSEDIAPKIVAVLKEAEKKRLAEAVFATRKRSSRIALRESEREERERQELARAENEARMERLRAEEERQERERVEREERERLRVERAKERERRFGGRAGSEDGFGGGTPELEGRWAKELAMLGGTSWAAMQTPTPPAGAAASGDAPLEGNAQASGSAPAGDAVRTTTAEPAPDQRESTHTSTLADLAAVAAFEPTAVLAAEPAPAPALAPAPAAVPPADAPVPHPQPSAQVPTLQPVPAAPAPPSPAVNGVSQQQPGP